MTFDSYFKKHEPGVGQLSHNNALSDYALLMPKGTHCATIRSHETIRLGPGEESTTH